MWAIFSFVVDPSSKGPVLCRDPRLRFVTRSRGDADDLGGRTAAPLVNCERRVFERRLEHTMLRPTQSLRLYPALPDSWCLSLRERLHRCRATTVRFEPRLVGNEQEEYIPVSAAVVTRTRSTCCLRRRCRAAKGLGSGKVSGRPREVSAAAPVAPPQMRGLWAVAVQKTTHGWRQKGMVDKFCCVRVHCSGFFHCRNPPVTPALSR